MTIFDDLQHISCLAGCQRLWSPIIKYQQFDAGERSQQSGVTRVAVGDGQVCEQPGNAGVEDGYVFSTRLVAERARQPTLAQAARPRYEEITPLGDPITDRELEEQRAVEAAKCLIIDVLDAGRVPELGDPGPCFKLLLSA
jgi:hypothetical protein